MALYTRDNVLNILFDLYQVDDYELDLANPDRTITLYFEKCIEKRFQPLQVEEDDDNYTPYYTETQLTDIKRQFLNEIEEFSDKNTSNSPKENKKKTENSLNKRVLKLEKDLKSLLSNFEKLQNIKENTP